MSGKYGRDDDRGRPGRDNLNRNQGRFQSPLPLRNDRDRSRSHNRRDEHRRQESSEGKLCFFVGESKLYNINPRSSHRKKSIW